MMVLLFVIWSNSFTAIRHLRSIFTPMELILARFLPFGLFMIGWLAFSAKARTEAAGMMRRSLWKILGMGLTGIAGYNYFLYLAQTEIKPGAAALITTLAPLMTLVLAIMILKEKVPGRRIAGIGIALIGLYLVIRYGKVGMGVVTGTTDAGVKYALIAALAPLSWSFYTIIGKDLVRSSPPFLLTGISTAAGTIPFLFLLDPGFIAKVGAMQLSHWVALGHLTLLCTMFGFWMWNFALRHLPATSVSSFVYLNPPLAALFGFLFFGEEVTVYFLAGSAVVLLGLYLSQARSQ
ncbi:MAG TPA: DMT family transporter [Candidatus Krumholzibacterium sp.]|nr:DMT family transporter [Candidatus Krumholzibacterium sp.]